LNTCDGALAMLKTAGFKIIEEEDLVLTAEVPWYEPLSPNRCALRPLPSLSTETQSNSGSLSDIGLPPRPTACGVATLCRSPPAEKLGW
jgi:hypothetical protein